MTEAKIHFKLGAVEFSAEGEKAWVVEQLNKLLEKIPEFTKMVPASANESKVGVHNPMGADSDIAKQSLAKFLKEKNATSNQVQKFLATAAWLEAKGTDRLAVVDITHALTHNKQGGLTNAHECLNKNISKGFCEKDDKKFFVTEDGRSHLENGNS